jgi:glycogen synthase
VKQAISLYRENPMLINGMIRHAMAIPYSWEKPAATYEYYYRLALVRRNGS